MRVVAMVIRVLLAGLLLAGTLPHAQGDPEYREASRRYAGPGPGPFDLCNLTNPSLGGACFWLDPSESTFKFIAVDDNALGLPAGGWYRLVHTFLGSATGYIPFCGGIEDTPAPAPFFEFDRVQLIVSVDPLYGTAACEFSGGIPTTGTIATWFK